MDAIKYTIATPILAVENRWEVTVSKAEGANINKDDMLQTATYAFYVDSKTKLDNGEFLLNLTPRG